MGRFGSRRRRTLGEGDDGAALFGRGNATLDREDPDEAERLFRLGADTGHGDAMHKLGQLMLGADRTAEAE